MGGVALLVFLLILYVVSVKLLWLAFSSKNWPSTTGVIIESKVVEVDSSDDAYYKSIIRYKFKVNSYPIECDNVTYECFNFVLNENEAKLEASKYKVDDVVTVYYHPFNNFEAVLVPGLFNKQIALVVAVGIMSVLLITLYVFGS